MIAAAMEMRKSGLSRKNMFVVPNNIVGQWEKMFTDLYPQAKVLAVEPKSFTPEKRNKVLSQIQKEDYDGVIIAYSLWRLLAERRKGAVSEWIFPNLLKLELPLNPAKAYRRFKKLLEIGELPDIRFHDLRHTFTSHAANSGIAPKTLSEIVGHSKASFTLDTYAHVTGDMQKNAANIVNNYITDILGKELKPWQNAENQAKGQ